MIRKNWSYTLLFLPILLVLSACSSLDMNIDDAISGQDADVVRGERLFGQPTIGSESAPGCITCHSLEEGVVIVGPSQVGMATRAGQAIPGTAASDYLRASIVEPDAFVAPGFAEGVMYPDYANDLTADEIDALVAFLLTAN